MPKKRAVRKTRIEVEKDRRRQKRKEYRRERKLRILRHFQTIRRIQTLLSIPRAIKKLEQRKFRTKYVWDFARRTFTNRLMRRAFVLYAQPDAISLKDKIEERPSFWREFLNRLFRELWYELLLWISGRDIREKIRWWHDYLRFLRTVYGVMFNRYKVLTWMVWRDRELELHFEQALYEALMSPELRDLTFEALNHIANELLVGNYEYIVPEPDWQRLKAIIQLLHKYFILYTKDMPCRRSNYAIVLTPLTLSFFRGLKVRMYVVRYVRVKDMYSGKLVIEKPIDVHFAFMRVFKYPFDLISFITFGGDSPSLSGTETIAISRDHRRNVREVLRTIVAMYNRSRLIDAMARTLGTPEARDNISHCSIYIGFIRTRKYDIKKQFKIERETFRRYRSLALG